MRHHCLLAGLLFAVLLNAGDGWAEDAGSLNLALESIQSSDLRRHVRHLADDTFEGREAGSRGGRAAGVYLGREFQKHQLAGGGTKQGYYQDYDAGSRNLLGLLEGSDPVLKQEIVLIGAHYDHVGYGSPSNSFGPVGRIHNGADDNASGTAGLLEVVEAFVRLDPRPKRTLLFALWDGEEKGLLGSKHWVANPTIPLERIRLAVNMDMIGRLRGNKLEIGGSRTARGLRQLVSRQNRDSDMLLDFTWEMKDNSDHHSFFARRIPVLMPFTGLHDDYHRPSDDAEKINDAGMQQIARLVFRVAYELAEAPQLPGFRPASQTESPEAQKQIERPLAALPGRLGISWEIGQTEGRGVRVTQVAPRSPAEQAGLRVGDRIVQFAGREVTSGPLFRSLVLVSTSPTTATFERAGEAAPLERSIKLTGGPVRLGLTWRVDEAEPDCIILTRVVTGSPAEIAGLRVNDRILAVGGQPFASGRDFQDLAVAAQSPVALTMERSGQTRELLLEIPAEAQTATARAPQTQR